MDPIDTTSFWDKINLWDKWLFIKINNQSANPVFDYIMPLIRESVYWAPLYLFFLVFVTMNFGKKGLWWSVCFLCLVAITDMVSSRVFKELFHRIRPCSDPDFMLYVRFLAKRCAGYSFTSSHAANHFGMATFFFLTFRNIFNKWVWIAYLWAFLIGYSQIYVGVHYPIDILGGAFFGVIVGLMVAGFFHKKFGMINFDKQPTVA